MTLTPRLVDVVSSRFKALAEPVRLHLLESLRAGERTVSELVQATGLGQANVSRHLQMLYALGFVTRRKAGQCVYYALADEHVFTLCDLMCGRIERELAAQQELLVA